MQVRQNMVNDHTLSKKTMKRSTSLYYQRNAANQRERRRMQSINEAFEGLRTHVPTLPYEKKLSKVDTLRLAINYIQFLTEIIETTQLDEIAGQKKVIICCSLQNLRGDDPSNIVTGHSLSWRRQKRNKNNKIVTSSIWMPEHGQVSSDSLTINL